MKNLMVILLVLALFQSTLGLYKIKQLQQLSSKDLDNDDLVEVIESSQTRGETKLMKNYYNLKVMRKDKKESYYKIKELYEQVVKVLIKDKIIPHEDQLVKSKIKPQYLSKKRSWLFSTIFVILGNEKQLQNTFIHLSRLGIQRLSTQPSINFLNEKILAIELFNSAKARLSQKIQKIGDFQIKSVKEIDIKGSHVENSDIIEEQLEQQFNQSEQIIEEQDLVEAQSMTPQQGDLQMTVIFRVGRKSENVSDDDNYDQDKIDQDQSEQSQSL